MRCGSSQNSKAMQNGAAKRAVCAGGWRPDARSTGMDAGCCALLLVAPLAMRRAAAATTCMAAQHGHSGWSGGARATQIAQIKHGASWRLHRQRRWQSSPNAHAGMQMCVELWPPALVCVLRVYAAFWSARGTGWEARTERYVECFTKH